MNFPLMLNENSYALKNGLLREVLEVTRYRRVTNFGGISSNSE